MKVLITGDAGYVERLTGYRPPTPVKTFVAKVADDPRSKMTEELPMPAAYAAATG